MTYFQPRSKQSAMHGAGEAVEKTVDYDLHGLLGIRLLNPSSSDIRAVERELGLRPAPFDGDPAISLRFVDKVGSPTPLRFLGREDVGFTADSFVLLRSRNLARARAQLWFETIGRSFEILCESGLPAVPLFRPLLNFAMLARGVIPVHAAAFNYAGRGVLVTGWSHGSKTGSLLAFMDQGAEFIGDEWIYLSPERNRMYGLPDHVEARPWYLRELPRYRRYVSRSDGLRLSVTGRLASALAPLVPASERRNSASAKLIRLAHQALVNQQSVHLSPLELFGPDSCALEGEPDVVIVALSHEAQDVVVEPTPVEHAARQMAASFLFEQAGLLSCYQKHLFAFPERRNELLDNAERLYVDLALRALAGKKAYTMLHPYPVSTRALQGAINPLLAEPGTSPHS